MGFYIINPTLWRYHELLPVANKENDITLGEGMTPLLPMPRLGKELGMHHLYLKDEGINPSGTFKSPRKWLWSSIPDQVSSIRMLWISTCLS